MLQAGDLAGARDAYQAVLAEHPTHPAALHGLGVLALRAGRADLAIGLIGQAARLVPDHAGTHLDLGLALRERGHIEEARAAFHVAALLDPADADAAAALGDLLARLGRLSEAEAAYRDAMRAAPKRAGIWHGLALVLIGMGRRSEAAAALRVAVALAPEDAAARNDLGGLLVDLGEPEAAEPELRAVLAIQPGHARALSNLGRALQDQERPHEALAVFQAAWALAPDDPDIASNLGVALRELDRTDEALAVFDAVLSRSPDHAPAHLNAASILLMRGEFARGWLEFEWRNRVPGAVARPSASPRWDGGALDGRTLLIDAEMGFGDTLQFCRFVPRIAGRVILRAHAPLVRLLGTLAGGAQVIPAGQDAPHDVACSLLSLPFLLGVDADGLASGPYLRAEPGAWTARRPGRRIGICWAGSRGYARDRGRSLPIEALRRLCGALGAPLISLQKDAKPPPGLPILDWTDELADFADTAALIAALDLVVSVDTAVAHLAGALGKPVLLLDRFAGDWRWMRGRTDNPWYPSVTIIRQAAPGDWDSVLAVVATLQS